MKFIRKFETLRLTDTPIVGGKNSSLGQMIHDLGPKGVKIPAGFAITVDAYWHFLEHNAVLKKMKDSMAQLTDYTDFKNLSRIGREIRTLVEQGTMPDDLAREIKQAYDELCKKYNQSNCDVAVRSSATAEDLPTASFAGQQETFLNVRGHEPLLKACIGSMASLFTDRAIVYRIEQGFDHFPLPFLLAYKK